jgi:Tfp pilus assembly protein PilO
MVAAVGLLVALVALAWARRVSRKLESLTQSYWELRYDYTRLRSQVAQLDPEQQQAEAEAEAAHAHAPTPTVSFVPLSSMRKKP